MHEYACVYKASYFIVTHNSVYNKHKVAHQMCSNNQTQLEHRGSN